MDLDIRYVAGLFDGEGWITIVKQRLGGYRQYHSDYVRYQLVAGIGMTHRPIIHILHRQFGGGFTINASAKAKQPKSRTGYQWKTSSGAAAEFLSLIYPHMVVKKEEAEIAILFQQHICETRLTLRHSPERRPELYAIRDGFHRQLLAFKKRTYDAPVSDDPVTVAA